MKNIVLPISLIILTACTSVYGNKNLGRERTVRSSMEQHSTRTEVVAEFGEPKRVFKNQNGEQIEYQRISLTPRAVAYIPIVAMIVVPFVGNQSKTNRLLIAQFDNAGKLTGFDTIYESGGYRR